jgi:hypothetical protein
VKCERISAANVARRTGILGCGLLADDAQRILLDDPSTSKADVESLPATDRFHLITFLIARVKAVRGRFVSAPANPSLVVAYFVCDQFILWHWH